MPSCALFFVILVFCLSSVKFLRLECGHFSQKAYSAALFSPSLAEPGAVPWVRARAHSSSSCRSRSRLPSKSQHFLIFVNLHVPCCLFYYFLFYIPRWFFGDNNKARRNGFAPFSGPVCDLSIDRLSKFVCCCQMAGLINLHFTVCITAATGKDHPPVAEPDVINQSELIISRCLLKCPKKVIRRGHEQRTVLDGILLIPPKRWVRVLLGNAVESLNKGFDPGRNGPEVQRRGKDNAVCRFDFKSHF